MKGFRFYIIACCALLTGYLVLEFTRPKPVDWTESYLKEDKIPYGLYILFNRIGDIFPGREVIISGKPVRTALSRTDPASYLVIANSLSLNSADLQALKQFASRGNQVFIAASTFGRTLSQEFSLKTADEAGLSGIQHTSFINLPFKGEQRYRFEYKVMPRYFKHFDSARAVVIGINGNKQANFLKFSFGKGSLYLMPNPQLLTNYSLLNPMGAAYAERALSLLPAGNSLLWDEHFTRNTGRDENVLRVLFRYDMLRWAYLLSITGVLLFVLYELKRRQRIIPMADPLRNSSVDFVRTVGQVYYHQRDHKDIAIKKMHFFLDYIRNTYRLEGSALDHRFEKELLRMSGAEEAVVAELLTVLRGLQGTGQLPERELVRFNQLIETFHQQSQ
ncbi:DUF4350 domain-containing protein [Pedobacter sp. JY14-1]|uniref:DUF4350 domain-containing protein n=1 Tax=Pedobacter sp. JY14-1 TaxID=3034151 RepID=UPI0023E33EF4|nr:DUF4350 domain-containing protein [Pedobacter sp. JY14-1]